MLEYQDNSWHRTQLDPSFPSFLFLQVPFSFTNLMSTSLSLTTNVLRNFDLHWFDEKKLLKECSLAIISIRFWRQNNSSKHRASKPLISASDFRSVTSQIWDTIKLIENSNYGGFNNGFWSNGESNYGE